MNPSSFHINKAYFSVSRNLELVDGYHIRNTLDIDFSGLADHDMNPIVPVGRLWLDKIYADEADFFIETYTKMRELMRSGKDYEEAKVAMRQPESGLVPRVNACGLLVGMKITRGDFEISLVDGQKVRRLFDPNFKYGGHGLVYDYVGQKNLIIIDDKILEAERPFIEEHEYREIVQMAVENWDYDDAHDYANAFEKIKRRRAGVSKYSKC